MRRVVGEDLGGVAGSSRRVRITDQSDAICVTCALRSGLGCTLDPLIDVLDRRHGETLGLAPGDMPTWDECMERVRTRVRPEDLDTLCAGCPTLASGVCKAALGRLLEMEMAAD